MMRGDLIKPTAGGLPADAWLDAIALRNEAVVEQPRGDGLVLRVPIRRRWWMRPPLGWLMRFRRDRGYELDALGRSVWVDVDGRRTLEQITERFADRHRLRFEEARRCVSLFLKTLVQRGLVAVVVCQADTSEPGRGESPA